MKCIVPTCDNNEASCISQGTTFHLFPTEPFRRTMWLKALKKEDWKPRNTSVICSKHFTKNDLYIDMNGQCKLSANAVPILNLMNLPSNNSWKATCDIKVCRICFATDCNLNAMPKCKNLVKAYETLTGLTVDNDDELPPYLCVECAQRLLNCYKFRTRSLRAHLVLLETIKKHNHITLESLKSTAGNESLFGSNLVVKVNPINQYDLEIEHVVSDHTDVIKVNKQPDIINEKNASTSNIKSESNDASHSDSCETIAINDMSHSIKLCVDVERIKTENDEVFDGDIISYRHEDEMISIDTTVGDPNSKGEKPPFEEERDPKNSALSVENSANIPKNTNTVPDNSVIKPVEANQPVTEELLCEICLYQTNNELRLLNHLKTHAKSTVFYCDLCNYKTNRKRYLKEHMKKVHSDDRKHTCNVCKKDFKVKNNLIRHLRLHSDETSYSCIICRKTFTRQGHYKTHLKIHSKQYSCTICNKKFIREDQFKNHTESHPQRKLYSCNVCKILFTRKYIMQNHMNLHTKENLYSCNICKKSFHRKNNLRRHLSVHGKKALMCDICGKCYSRELNLKIHIKSHSYRSQYKCDGCKKIFGAKHKLQMHLAKFCPNKYNSTL